MLSMTGLAFIGTVTFARFVAREVRPPGYRPSRDGEPGTGTGPLDAIHFDNGDDDERWPANVVGPTTTSDAEEEGAELRSEEHTSELQSRGHLVCRLLLEKKKQLTLN